MKILKLESWRQYHETERSNVYLQPVQKAGKNSNAFETEEYVETTFEHQYLVRNPGMEEGAALWWMRPKENFRDPHEKNLPHYLYLPPEHLMLLK